MFKHINDNLRKFLFIICTSSEKIENRIYTFKFNIKSRIYKKLLMQQHDYNHKYNAVPNFTYVCICQLNPNKEMLIMISNVHSKGPSI